MFQQLVSLVLLPLLLLPSGVCPCHLFEDHSEEALCSFDGGHHEDHNLKTHDTPHHEEEPCDNCQARELTEGQFTSTPNQSFYPDTLTVYVALGELPLPALNTFSWAVLFSSGPDPWSSTPIYLKLRALLL